MTPDLMNDWILDAESRQSWTHAVVSYDGGDSLDVPLKRPLAR
jgi:hypothetical protein